MPRFRPYAGHRLLRSPPETMDGWAHLPRYVDKIRLHLAGKLIEAVRGTLTDGVVYHWVRTHVVRSEAGKARAVHAILRYPLLAGRDDIQTRAALIDADEGRLPASPPNS